MIEAQAPSQNMQDKFAACEPIQCRITIISAILPAGRRTEQLGRDGPPGRARSPGRNFREELHSLLYNTKMIINYFIKTKIQFITNFYYLKS